MAILVLVGILLGLPAMTLTGETGSARTLKPTTRATLAIVATQPVTIVGRRFKPAEHVRVTANARRKTVTAGLGGGFKVVFPLVNACDGVIVAARGSEGSRASITFAQFSNVHCLEPTD